MKVACPLTGGDTAVLLGSPPTLTVWQHHLASPAVTLTLSSHRAPTLIFIKSLFPLHICEAVFRETFLDPLEIRKHTIY